MSPSCVVASCSRNVIDLPSRAFLSLVPPFPVPTLCLYALSTSSALNRTSSATAPGSGQSSGASPFLAIQQRFFRTKGVLKLHCSECRYVVRKRNVPILAVDCNANVRHKQLMSNTPHQSRPTPDWLTPWIEGKQYPRHPKWKQDFTYTWFSKKRYTRNTHW
ncbi:unnamed protein product [Amoebophrya sp. A25]|nr:unnamed protein product [Amoebophrya sp. A25]|eukprot:GSA25T00013388001.1